MKWLRPIKTKTGTVNQADAQFWLIGKAEEYSVPKDKSRVWSEELLISTVLSYNPPGHLTVSKADVYKELIEYANTRLDKLDVKFDRNLSYLIFNNVSRAKQRELKEEYSNLREQLIEVKIFLDMMKDLKSKLLREM